MSRRDQQRLDDIEAACLAILDHMKRGSLDDGLILDAVCMRLIEIGEAVKGLDPELLTLDRSVPWRQVARMRDHLAHRYFATEVNAVQDVVAHDIEPLLAAARRISLQLNTEGVERL